MPSLNEGFEDNLSSDLPLISDFTQPDNSLTSETQEIPHKGFLAVYGNDIVSPITNDVTIKDIFGDDVKPNILPDLKADIILIEQSNNILADAGEIHSNVISRCSVCQEDIAAFDSAVPGFLNDEECIEYYTKSPTITRYKTAIGSMSSFIDKEQLNQKQIFSNICINLNKGIIETLEYLDTNLINKIDQINLIKNKSSGKIIELNIEDFLSSYSVTLRNILNSEILYQTPMFGQALLNEIINLIPVINSTDNFSIEELISFIGSDKQFNIFKTIQNMLVVSNDVVADILREVTNSNVKKEEVTKLIIDNIETIQFQYELVIKIHKLINEFYKIHILVLCKIT